MIDLKPQLESGFSDIDSSSDPEKYVRRLDNTGSSDFWKMVKIQMLELLQVDCGASVLDVGCGTGDDVQALAQIVGTEGRAVGIDSSATMIREAARRATSSHQAVEYYKNDACRLEFADKTFDACRLERVLQHVHEPIQVMREVMRVSKASARIVVAEPDYGALHIAGADESLTRKILDCRCAHFRSGRVGRALPSLFQALGLNDLVVRLLPLVSSNMNMTDETERSMIMKYAESALAVGAITRDESETWLHQLNESAVRGEFLHSSMVFLVAGRKPVMN